MPPGDETAAAQAEFAAAVERLRAGDRDGAAAALGRLAEAAHRDADLHYNCAVLAGALGRPELEEGFYRAALAANPGDAAALNNLGNLLRRAGRLAEALAEFDRAIAASDREPFLFHNRGLVLHGLGRAEAALADQARALALKADYAGAHAARGTVLAGGGRHEEGLASLEEAVRLDPGLAGAWTERGIVLESLGRRAEALASYERASALDPGAPEPWANRGLLLALLGREEEALACTRRALAIRPEFAAAHRNLGVVLEQRRELEAAAGSFARAFALDPDFDCLAGDLLGARLQLCDWRDHAGAVRRIEDAVARGARATGPFIFLAASDDPALQLACARAWIGARHPPAARALCAGRIRRDGPIRVAYLSADFRRHPIGLLAAGLFEAHDRRGFEIAAVSFGPDTGDPVRARLERAFDRFVDVRDRSDRAAAEAIAAFEADIAVDLMGITQGCRPGILALRPAPVQVGWLGYPGTTGAGYVDYIVADRIVIPAHREDCYAERVVRLPDSYQVNDSSRPLPARTPGRAGAGLPAEGFVFCSFNQSYKMAPRVFDAWMRVLGAVPGSVLWLFSGEPAVAHNLRRAAAERGVAPDRLVFAPPVAAGEHLARQGAADLFLDTAPYGAHTTASDALWVGLPVLTCPGESFASRVAASLLHAIGAPELVAPSLAEYERLAVALARDPARLAALRARIVANRRTHPLFDTARFARHLEAAYRTMHEIARHGEPPRGFAVPAVD